MNFNLRVITVVKSLWKSPACNLAHLQNLCILLLLFEKNKIKRMTCYLRWLACDKSIKLNTVGSWRERDWVCRRKLPQPCVRVQCAAGANIRSWYWRYTCIIDDAARVRGCKEGCLVLDCPIVVVIGWIAWLCWYYDCSNTTWIDNC